MVNIQLFNMFKRFINYIFSILKIQKTINMLPINKLRALKEISHDLKNDIQIHHNADPGNIDNFENLQLYGLLSAVLTNIGKIEEHNNIKV